MKNDEQVTLFLILHFSNFHITFQYHHRLCILQDIDKYLSSMFVISKYNNLLISSHFSIKAFSIRAKLSRMKIFSLKTPCAW
mmetsp:Transcript_29017/g.31654  ORF Transcript_29017/g.31654 Transcript_29017/m.31654 type:complete len:82 (-) Transcript_29017:86-331(-)